MFAFVRKAAAALRPAIRLQGTAAGRPWQLHEGPPSRDYIHGRELLARCELGLPDDVGIVLMNRPLKEALEQSAYERYVAAEETLASTGLPEELRWLSTYQEARLSRLPRAFWRRWAVLSQEPAHAGQWITAGLAELLMDWPGELDRQTPCVLMLLRGRAYLRLQYAPRSPPVARHAAEVFGQACAAAVRAFPPPRP